MKFVIEAADSMGNVIHLQYPTRKARDRVIETKVGSHSLQTLGLYGWTARDEPEMVERTNLMTGKVYLEERDTPLCLSPASETYWSM